MDQIVSGHVKQPYRNFKINNKQLLVSDDNCFVNSLNFQNVTFKEFYNLTPTLFKAIYYCLVKQSTNYSMLFFSHNHKHIIFFFSSLQNISYYWNTHTYIQHYPYPHQIVTYKSKCRGELLYPQYEHCTWSKNGGDSRRR